MATQTTATVLTGQNQQKTVESLQRNLLDLLNLGLQLKQVHWNLRGPHFRPVHLQLDEIVADARDASDEVAERIATLGEPADGRAATIAENSTLDAVPEGLIRDEDGVSLMCDRLVAVSSRLRAAIDTTDKTDQVTQDLLIGICGKLEKHMWMLRSQLE
ncbi:MAG TPA: DNA starvation/stationary phase protection protein [Phycisphaerae bacterium]|nr:DNA starvation/stationary phase protection protein [Phycisphaerales bacterium]HRX86027.1 DNA starvation/stationary phase protection protein [Phycisphaerae bacterium]